MSAQAEHALRPARRCVLPWTLLALLVVALAAVAWWGYSRRAEVTQYAIASVMEQALGDVVPPGTDPERVAARMAALMRAFKEGRVDPERLRGGGEMLRQYYADRRLDPMEFESLLTFFEASVER
jgi:hypothetical protein